MGCSTLGYNNLQSGHARIVPINPSFPIGVISKAEVVSDPAGLLATGNEAYNHISLQQQSTPIWKLKGDWGNGFKPDDNSNQEQIIKIHSAVVEVDSGLEYLASNGQLYNNVQDIAADFGCGLYSPNIYLTSVNGGKAFHSINDFYNTHISLADKSFFFETVVYADGLTPC